MDHTKRFDGKGDVYAKARPSYAPQLFAYMKQTLHIPEGSVFADIGSGTGIFAKQLLECGYHVYGVEPNADMRRKAEEVLAGNARFHSVNGCERDSGLDAHSVDYVSAAQSFHWFDAARFKRECRRILKPNGKICIVYNERNKDAECTKALRKLRKTYNPSFSDFSNGIDDAACRLFFDDDCDCFSCDNSVSYDRQGYLDRVLSSSYSLTEQDERYEEYTQSIHALFDRFAVDGIITIPMHTIAYIG